MFHRHDLSAAPDLLALHQFKPDAYPYLLASNTGGHANARYSILMAYPEAAIEQTLNGVDVLSHIPIALTETALSEATDLPFIGGWFVFLGYEYGGLVESSVDFLDEAVSGLPSAFVAKVPAAIIVDQQSGLATLVAESGRSELIEQIVQDIAEAPDFAPQSLPCASVQEEAPDIYRNSLAKVQSYIRDGDIFQANLSRLWLADFDSSVDPISLYARLKSVNPAPFAAFVKHGDSYVISSSPERLVSVVNGIAETRPIAGTHPRDANPERDAELSQNLLAHPKERAEHVMLIDLERNDLGRVCVPGSIHVGDRMVLETYQTVHHIVSSVRGQLVADTSVRSVVHAVFPGGTITGCPKVRCMQIISELEGQARGAYTGSLGYVSNHGRMDLNILIRTLTLKGQRVLFRAGAGIVADSETEKELNETRHKARGMLNVFSPDH